MKKIIGLLVLLGLGQAGWGANIVYPWRATTAIVKAGGHFEVWFNADDGQTVNAVELKGPYNQIAVEMSRETGDWVYDELSKNTFNTKLSVTVPEGVPSDRYALILKTSAGDEISTGAVKVIRDYRKHYYILQFSDAHRWQGGHDGMHTMRKVSEILKIARIIDPEIIVETGDNMYNVRNHPEREASYFHGFPAEGILGMHDVPAATFIAAGNHDSPNNSYPKDANVAETADFFNTYYGLHVHNFIYGNGRYCVFNNAWGTGSVDLTGQANAAARWLNAVGRGNLIVGAAHIMDAEFQPFYDVVEVDLGLAGHNHYLARENPRPLNAKPVLFLADSVRDAGNFEFNLFRVNNETGEYIPVAGPDGRCLVIQGEEPDLIADPERWIPNLELNYSKANDGSEPSNTATLVNRYDFPVPDARVRFVMPMGKTYAVTGGAVEQAFDGDEARVIDVRVPLPANSTVEAKVESVAF